MNRKAANPGTRSDLRTFGPEARLLLLCLCAFVASCLPALAQQRVRAWQGKLDLPTYALGEEDPNPPFPLIKGSHVYPYTMLDDLTDRRDTKSYQAVFLENDYLKATVLPSLGGRLYSLFDKASGREVFYRNNVVKYGLVALRGAWISGGVEFNFPDGHTLVTVSPVAWTLLENPDGSATVTVGEIDRVTGMHWEVALTLHPGEARLEQRVTLFNPTPLTNRYWYWANAAVPATDNMQFIYPMREAYPHARWPVFTYPVYESVDYSWYKNVRQPTSLFGRQVHRDFFGAYYHNADAGVVHVADFREVPGKKVWTWGMAGDGLIWSDLLTDHDGPYNEIQSGRYETQLNYEFLAPRRAESWTEYWYPVRGLDGGFVAAEKDVALNVRDAAGASPGESQVEIVLCPTVALDQVRLRVKLGSEVLREVTGVALKPLDPAKFDVPVKDLETAKSRLEVELESAGRTLLRWSPADPVDGNRDFVPATGAPPPQPRDPAKMTVDELFLVGLGEEKDGQELAAEKTYAQVLERDPGYIPALLKQAWWQYRGADFPAAEQSVARALARDTTDPEVHYAAGVIYRATGRWTLAADALWASIHYGGPPACAFAQLGELAIIEKRYSDAADLLRRALSYDPQDALALADLSVAERLAGSQSEARKAVNAALELMPLLPFAVAEASRAEASDATAGSVQPAAMLGKMHAPGAEDYLEAAAWYRSLGDDSSADSVLEAALKSLGRDLVSPLVYYYLASDARSESATDKAEQFAAQAAAASYRGVFPQRLSDAVVLADAIAHNPLDARAKFYLGNFLFAHGRYDAASKLWLAALAAGFDDPVLERNLGVNAWRVTKDLNAAAAYYQRGVQLAPGEFRLYLDLDEIYAQQGDTARRAKLFAQAPAAVLDRDTVRARRALLLAEQKRFDNALGLLKDHRFKPWEGGEVVRRIYVFASIEGGKAKLLAGKPGDAEQAFRRGLEYPVNLGVGKPDKPHDEPLLYWLGEALEAEGKHDAAREAWQQAVAEESAVGPFGRESSAESQLYAALALGRLGQRDEAERTLGSLMAAATKENAGADDLYVAGLVEKFRHHEDQARNDFRRALEVDPAFWQARLEL